MMSEIHKIFKGASAENSGSVDLEFYHLYKNGQLTWLVDSGSKLPNIRKLYSASTLFGRAFIVLVELLWRCKLQGLLFKKLKIKCDTYSPYYVIHQGDFINKTIFTGTVGDNRKAVVYGDGKTQKVFFKIPIGEGSHQLVRHEKEVLEHVASIELESIVYPRVIDGYRLLSISDVSDASCKPYGVVDEKAIAFCEELYGKTKELLTFSELVTKHHINVQWPEYTEQVKCLSNKRLMTGLIDLLSGCQSMYSALRESKIECCFSHGDFTPWNCFHTQQALIVIDWELSGTYPLYFDIIHHVVATHTLIGEPNFDHVLTALDEVRNRIKANVKLRESAAKFDSYVQLYALINGLYYSKKFMLQDEDIHIQAYSLIDTWTRLLNYE